MRNVSPARIGVLNLGIQLVWGAILGISLQSRTLSLAPKASAISAYADIFALGAFVATIVQLGAGVLSDRARRARGNRVPFYVAGTALAIPAIVWFYLTPSLWGLCAAFVALELAMNVLCGPYQAVIADYVEPERRGVASSWMSGLQSLGGACGLVIAGLIADVRIVAGAIAVPLAACSLATVSYVRRIPAREAGDTAGGASLGALRGPLGVLLLSRGLINVGFFTLLGFLLFFVRDSLGITGPATTAQTGFLFLTFTLCAIPGAALAAKPVDRHDKRAAVTCSVATVSVALLGLALAPGLPLAYASAALAGAGWGAFVTADWALATVVLPPGALATSMGIWNVATTLPQVVAPLLTAPLVNHFNVAASGAGPRAAIVLALLEFALGGACIWGLPRR